MGSYDLYGIRKLKLVVSSIEAQAEPDGLRIPGVSFEPMYITGFNI